MRRAEKVVLMCLLILLIAGSTGCDMKPDIISYVDATMDLFIKGEAEEYMKLTKSTEEEAAKIYNDYIDIWTNFLIADEISEELKENFREIFREVFAEARYQVKSSKKVKNERKYIVTIEVEKITGLFEGLKTEVGMKLRDWEYAQKKRPNDEEYDRVGYQILYECMRGRQKELTYYEPEEITIEVAEEEGNYGIVNGGYRTIRDALISMEGLAEKE